MGEIIAKLAILKKKIQASDDSNQDEIVAALVEYQKKLKASMKLDKADFTGEGKDDFKFVFNMPYTCKSAEDCRWICENMIKVDGVSEKAIESDQNVKIEDLEADDDQQFESDLVVIDDSDDDQIVTDGTTGRRMLAEEDDTVIIYDAEGYVADDDTFEASVADIIDDSEFSAAIEVPEDKINPGTGKEDTGDDTDDNKKGGDSDDGIPMWVWILGGVATLAIIGGVVFAFTRKSDDDMEDEAGIDMPRVSHSHEHMHTHVDHRI